MYVFNKLTRMTFFLFGHCYYYKSPKSRNYGRTCNVNKTKELSDLIFIPQM